MKHVYMILLAALLVGVVAYAAQDSTITEKELRDPKQLRTWLQTNAADAESRVAALEGGSTVGTVDPGYIIVGNASSQGVDVAVSGDVTIDNAGAVSFAAGTLSTNVIIGTTYTNTFVFRTLASGVIVLDSITQDAI